MQGAVYGFRVSISQESLAAANKTHNRVDDYRRLIAMLHRYGIAVHLGIMFGFDQDDVGIFRRTAECLDEACVDEKSQIQALDLTQPLLPMRRANPSGALMIMFGTAPRRCSPRWRSRAARSSGSVISGIVPSSSPNSSIP